MRNVIEYSKQHQYAITIIFIFLETVEVSINRISERVLNGGHSVPERDIIRRFFRSKKNFWNIYKDMANRWHLIYNSGDTFEVIAVGEGSEYIINDEKAFQIFLKDIER